MASELKVNTLTGVSTAGSIAVTAEGNSTTTNLQGGLTKTWSVWNKNDDSITDSLNLSGDTDNGTGDQTLSYTNNMATAKGYGVIGNGCHTSALSTAVYVQMPKEDDEIKTSEITLYQNYATASTASKADRYWNFAGIWGDLA